MESFCKENFAETLPFASARTNSEPFFSALILPFPVFWVQKGGMNYASMWGDLKLLKSLCWNPKAAACAMEWLQTLRRVFPCIYLKLPGRMTALQINTLFSAWGESGKLFLLWLYWCSMEWWHLPQLRSLARFWAYLQPSGRLVSFLAKLLVPRCR